MTIEYWVHAQKGLDENSGSNEEKKKSIQGARGSQSTGDVDGGMKYRGGIVHIEGIFRRSFVYPTNQSWPVILNGGNVINEWCPAAPTSSNEQYFPEDNWLVFEADGDEKAILSAFEVDPEPSKFNTSTQGGPAIRIQNKRRININGHFNLEVWGGLPEPVEIISTSPMQPTDDIYIREVIFKYVDPKKIYKMTKEGGRRIWFEHCLIDPDGTGSKVVELHDQKYVRGGFKAGAVNTRIA